MHSHLEGHIEGSHGKISDFAKAGATLVYLGTILGGGMMVGGVAYEKLSAYQAADVQRVLEENSVGDVTGKIRSGLGKCHESFRLCEGAIQGFEEADALEVKALGSDSQDPENIGDFDFQGQSHPNPFLNIPKYARCAMDKLDCLTKLEDGGKK